MKNIKVAISIVFGILSSLIIITILENGKDYSYFEKTDTNEELFIQDINYSTDIDLIKKSDIISEIKVIEQSEIFEHKGVNFILSKVIVKNCINGNVDKGNKIEILQTVIDNNEMEILSLNEDYVLFLEKYRGPIVENAYVISGVNLGMLKVIGEEIQLNKVQYDNFQILENNSRINKKELINEISKNIE
ncbi:hypothetical protein [Thomasclavelia cocleata]|jgi:hypothetical protein|uniref:hypothetical protein n=1 Tax=Thomasclavelia cocleata TaxID=69824 RepID=UPI00241C5DEF|nr:hypothetical protein [Thomasclavelia cocleata]MCI9132526.1 hypothetical protein [Thomasclavelia cocleata]